jgi:hypothetical protein
MIVIPVPLWVAVGIVAIACVGWLVDLPQRQRKREAQRQARLRLIEDLRGPTPSASLPYSSRPPE